jgi:RNase P subunit RPR2
MLGQPQRIKASYCSSCKKVLDGTSCVDDEDKPKSGDITICLYCGNLMAFNDDLILRQLTEGETSMVANDESIQKLLRKIHFNPLFAKSNKH